MANVQIRMSEDEKAAVQVVLKSMGLTLSGAVKMFLRQVVLERKIPFEISANAGTNGDTCPPFTKHKIG